MKADKATPRPWIGESTSVYALEKVFPTRGKPYIQNRFYAGVQGPYTTPIEEIEANTALIVKAVNSYSYLLSACEAMLVDIEDTLVDCDSPGTRQTLEIQRTFLKEAIDKTKE